MRSAATLLLASVVVIVQATVVNRLPFEWWAGPDLVVAMVTAVALTSSPAAAAGCGFAAGLAMDVLPPSEHAMGRYALVLCLAAYLLALLNKNTGANGDLSGRLAVGAAVGVTAVTSVGVGLGYAAVGLVMGDPRLSLVEAALNVLVGTVLTALVSPLVLIPVLWIRGALSGGEFDTVRGPVPLRRW